MHGDRSFPGENSFYSFFRLTFGLPSRGHRNSLPPDASGRSVQGFEKFQQDSGVVLAVGTIRQSGFVAGLLCKIGKLPVEIPCERAEPEDGAMQQRETLGEAVA